MASSYDKIKESFIQSPEWKDLTLNLRHEISQGGIEGFTFEFYQPNDELNEKNCVAPFFEVVCGGAKIKRGDSSFSGFCFPAEPFVHSKRLNEIAKALFDTKGYPTYFCKRDKLMEGDKKVTQWSDFARRRFLADNADVVGDFEKRVLLQHAAIKSSTEWLQGKTRAFELGVIREIRDVVLKYYEVVTPDVIKEALDEVVTHAIMES